MAEYVIGASALVGAFGSIEGGAEAKETADKTAAMQKVQGAGTARIHEEMADLDFLHATHALEEAGLTKEMGELNMLLARRKAAASESTVLARQGKSGATVGTGSARETLSDVIFENEIELAADKLGIDTAVWEKQYAGTTYKRQGMIQLDEAKLGLAISGMQAGITEEKGESALMGGFYQGLSDVGLGVRSILSLQRGSR